MLIKNLRYCCNPTIVCKTISFFAFAAFFLPLNTMSQATPGGVSGNLVLWLNAGAGTSTSTNNTALTTWTDLTGSAFSFTADHSNGPEDPTFLSSGINFNPSVLYSAAAMHTIPVSTGPSLLNSTVFVVGKPGTTGGDTYNSIWTSYSATANRTWSPILNNNQVGAYDALSTEQFLPTLTWNVGEVSFIRSQVSNVGPYDIALSKQGSAAQTIPGFFTSDVTTNQFFALGNNPDPSFSEPFGQIAESLIYSTPLSTAETQQVESYLSFKYGITLDQSVTPQSYIASDGATLMWDGDYASLIAITSDVFGIGQDANGGLDQRISQSTNPDGGVLTVATTNDFTAPNADPGRTSLSDLNFETFANNDAANTWTTTGAPDGFYILERQWQVQENGSIGAVNLQFDVDNAVFNIPDISGGTNYYLVTDPNADGDYTDGTITMLTNTSGSLWSASIDLTNQSVFTIATGLKPSAGIDRGACATGGKLYLTGMPATNGVWSEQAGNPAAVVLGATAAMNIDSVSFTVPGVYNFIYTYTTNGATDTMKVTVGNCAAPGGVVSHLALWLKAEAGTGTLADNDPVATWSDTTSNAWTMGVSPVDNPLFKANGMNYNPSILYGSNQYHTLPGTIPTENSSVFVTGIPLATSSVDPVHAPWTSQDENDFALIINNTQLGHFGNGGKYANNWADNEASFAREHIFSTATNDVIVSKQGSPDTTLSAVASNTSGYYYLGNEANNNEGFGQIAETFIYDAADMTAADKQKIESYSALKYGLTLDNRAGGTAGNYILSDGTPAWDAAADPAHHNRVIGIVRDDLSALVQKQSHTSNDSLRLFVGSLAASNQANAGTITNNLSSIIIGDNAGLSHDDPAATKPTGIFHMFGRSWKITNTNFADNFSIEIKWDSAGPFTLSDIRLLVSASPDFSAATVYNAPDVTFSLGSIIVSGISTTIIPANATMYFTIGSASPSTTLPISLTAFNATAINNSSVALNWQTSAEFHNDYFTVQKSKDGFAWKDVAQVNGAGNSSTVKNYSAVDNSPYKGASYYRLKQTDIDGHYTYSPLKTVNITSGALISIYPNPATTTIIIEGSAAELSNTRLFNVTGQDVTNLTRMVTDNGTRIILDVSHLSRGVYTIKTATTASKISKQ